MQSAGRSESSSKYIETEIEQRKNLENALREALAARQEAEAQRDRLLASEQALRKETEVANRLRDQFLAIVSHELRTPMAAIVGWTSIVTRRPDDKELLGRALEVIGRNGSLQLKLIEDLLDVSRMLTGRMTVNKGTVELASVVKVAVESLHPDATLKGIDLRTHIEPADYVMNGDAIRLHQVVGNILANAVKFTPEGGWIEVSLKRTGSNAEITIADNGEGISAEFLPFVFGRFTQADDSLTHKQEGMGLGLAMVRYLVEAHEGCVRASSAGAGCGATFNVTLPLLSSI